MTKKFWKGIIIGLLIVLPSWAFGATTELGLGNTHKYQIIPVGDILKVPEGATGCTIHDDGIPGTLDLDEQVGADTLAAGIIEGDTLNGNMETGDPPTTWTWVNATSDGVADERDGGAGIQSLEITLTAGNGYAYKDIAVEVGKLYEVGFWHKVSAGDTQYVRVSETTGWTTLVQSPNYANVGWENHADYFVATTIEVRVYLRAPTNGDIVYFDDIVVAEVTSDTGIYNTWITDIDLAGLGADEPVLFFNCAFEDPKATIEAKNAADVLFFDDECQFSIITGDCFVDYAGANYHLNAGGPLTDGGQDTGADVDLDGIVTPQGVAHCIGPYEFISLGWYFWYVLGAF